MAIHANSTPVPTCPLVGPAAALSRLLAPYPAAYLHTQALRSHRDSRGATPRQSELLAILDAGPIAPADLAHLSRQQRRRAEHGIAALIDLLDALDPDPDLEDGGDTEPNCGDFGATDEREDDAADDEPSLGATCFGSLWQDLWCSGTRADLEEQCEDEGACIQSQPHDPEPNEPSLGSLQCIDQEHWAEGEDLWGRVDLELDESDYEYGDERQPRPAFA